MNTSIAVVSMVLAATFLGSAPTAFAEDDAALAGALKEVSLSLERGLSASARRGTPISAKYELEDGVLQLSVYTMKGGAFAEVIVDHKTGKIAKSTPIKDGEDLAAARSQKDAMARAKRSLGTAVAEAVKGNAGYRAVSATPELKDGHPAVKVMLLNGGEWKTLYPTLD